MPKVEARHRLRLAVDRQESPNKSDAVNRSGLSVVFSYFGVRGSLIRGDPPLRGGLRNFMLRRTGLPLRGRSRPCNGPCFAGPMKFRILHGDQIVRAVPDIDLAIVRLDFLGGVAFDLDQPFKHRVILAAECHNHIFQ